MATTSTKSIAARIPYDEYVRLLNEATLNKLSLSDYFILLMEAGRRVVQAEDGQLELTQIVRQRQEEVNKLVTQAEQQRIKHLQDMALLQKQADSAQQSLHTALNKVNQQLAAEEENAEEWHTYADSVLQQKTDLEQTIKILQQTRDQQQNQLTQLKAQNALLTVENHKLQQESSAVKAELDTLRQQVLNTLEELTDLHNESTINYIPNRYWPILDAIKERLEAK